LSNSIEKHSISVEIHRHTPSSPWTYESLDRRQREIAREVEKGASGVLLLSEVAPVITVGRRTPKTDLLFDERSLSELGIERIETDRGGLATYHGPGQWVLFPVDKLERLTGDPRGVRLAVDALLRISQRVAGGFGVQTEVRANAELGVWTERGKLSAVGIHIEKGILMHGLSLNVFRTPESFAGIRPCGLDAAVDFLAGETILDQAPDGRDAILERAKTALVEAAFTELWRK
jgi:lipoate-protein ligase B